MARYIHGTWHLKIRHVRMISPFEKGVGTFYRSPDYEIMSVTFEGDDVYTVDAADGEKGLTAENRIQYTTLGNILNVPVNAEVDVTFTENGNPSDSNRVIVNDALPPKITTSVLLMLATECYRL